MKNNTQGYYINKDNSVDIYVGGDTQGVTVLSELIEEISYDLSSRPFSEAQFKRMEAGRDERLELTKEQDAALSNQAQVERDTMQRGKDIGNSLSRDDDAYNDAKQDGVI